MSSLFVLTYLCAILLLSTQKTNSNSNNLKEEFKYKDGLLLLNDDNFETAIKKFDYVLVAFTVEKCGQCEIVRDEYMKTLKLMEENKLDFELKLAEVNLTESEALTQEHVRRIIPTIKFFKKGRALWYKGERNAEGFMKWIKGKVEPQAIELDSFGAARKHLDEKDVVIMGFFKDTKSETVELFKQIADVLDDFDFAYTTNQNVYNGLEIKKDGIVIFKASGDTSEYDGDYSEQHLMKWIPENSLPLVVYYTPEISYLLYDQVKQKLHLYLFISKNDDEYDELKTVMEAAALEFKNKIVFVIMDSTLPGVKHILDYFRLDTSDLPEIRICNLTQEPFVKYRPDFEVITLEKMKTFVQNFLDGTLEPFILSQELPDDWRDAPIKVLSVKVMDKFITESDKDVVLLFHKPNCEKSKEFLDIWDQLAKNLTEENDFYLATIDEAKNELSADQESFSPMIVLFQKITKTPYLYNGTSTIEEVKQFIANRGSHFGVQYNAEILSENAEEQSHSEL